mmetsp:Transcript_9908/g.22113  ORF Transcript_9908/g.22113 Transcript_9908/m.22113 type:complete len:205 (+) Transcript_9908:645-1259(+)
MRRAALLPLPRHRGTLAGRPPPVHEPGGARGLFLRGGGAARKGGRGGGRAGHRVRLSQALRGRRSVAAASRVSARRDERGRVRSGGVGRPSSAGKRRARSSYRTCVAARRDQRGEAVENTGRAPERSIWAGSLADAIRGGSSGYGYQIWKRWGDEICAGADRMHHRRKIDRGWDGNRGRTAATHNFTSHGINGEVIKRWQYITQ